MDLRYSLHSSGQLVWNIEKSSTKYLTIVDAVSVFIRKILYGFYANSCTRIIGRGFLGLPRKGISIHKPTPNFSDDVGAQCHSSLIKMRILSIKQVAEESHTNDGPVHNHSLILVSVRLHQFVTIQNRAQSSHLVSTKTINSLSR